MPPLTQKPEVGEILVITDKDEDLHGIGRHWKLKEVRVIEIEEPINEEYELWGTRAEVISPIEEGNITPIFHGWVGKTFLRKEKKEPVKVIEKTPCPICGSEDDFCICKLLM